MFINTKQSFQSEGIKPGERNVGKYGQECSVYFGLEKTGFLGSAGFLFSTEHRCLVVNLQCPPLGD